MYLYFEFCTFKIPFQNTLQIVNVDMKRQSVALACKRIIGRYTYDVIAEHLLNINSQYGLDHRKICFTITDNGSNMIKAFSELQAPSAVTTVMTARYKVTVCVCETSRLRYCWCIIAVA